ncbi:MAG TPA: ribosomal protein S18-alanine N-acetyltransferase [Chthonomonadaceae bacterium]|nr:ribosomal protein S18-alanine N-acetyltransferase [Chthonomonadaceae bacterium]
MRICDLDAVEAIDRRAFPQPWQRSVYEVELGNRAAFYLIARIGVEIVGYGGAWVVGEEAHVTTLAVDPRHRGVRAGERLLLTLMEEAVMRRASHATLEVRESNRAAQTLYRKYGFVNAAIRKSYYKDTGENAIVMWAGAIHTLVYRQRLYELRRQLDYGAPAERFAS